MALTNGLGLKRRMTTNLESLAAQQEPSKRKSAWDSAVLNYLIADTAGSWVDSERFVSIKSGSI